MMFLLKQKVPLWQICMEVEKTHNSATIKKKKFDSPYLIYMKKTGIWVTNIVINMGMYKWIDKKRKLLEHCHGRMQTNKCRMKR